MKRLAETWSSFPPEHKKRCLQGIAGYAGLMVLLSVWVGIHAHDTVREWEGRIPSATASIRALDTGTASPPDVTADMTPETEKQAVSIPANGVPDELNIPAPDGKTYISIIVTGLGMSKDITEKALDELPPGVSFAFSPYADNLQEWMGKARVMKREALLLMPMESSDYPVSDPGPKALSSRFSDDDNNKNMEWVLERGAGVAGVINYMGSRFLTDTRRLPSLFSALKQKNAIFIETPGVQNSQAKKLASDANLPYMAADLQIDTVATEAEIRKQLQQLEKIAQERGYAVGVADSYPVTFSTIRSWSAGLGRAGITLAPVKRVWKNKPRDEEPAAPPPVTELTKP